MFSLRVFCSIGLAVLLISASVSAEVYDDQGQVITEEEIAAETKSTGSTSCCSNENGSRR